ncbi:MAG: hypothetical protein HY682_02870 [Chloroflexi bacterium]|nr:hypothetical protein [Chloroflexota bacterium]
MAVLTLAGIPKGVGVGVGAAAFIQGCPGVAVGVRVERKKTAVDGRRDVDVLWITSWCGAISRKVRACLDEYRDQQ